MFKKNIFQPMIKLLAVLAAAAQLLIPKQPGSRKNINHTVIRYVN
jgi:hypothetical protein